jgi:hypothetical protein
LFWYQICIHDYPWLSNYRSPCRICFVLFCYMSYWIPMDTLCFKPWKASGLVAKLQVPGCPVWPVKTQRDPTAVAIAAGQAVTVTGQRSSKQGLSGKTWKDSPLDKWYM